MVTGTVLSVRDSVVDARFPQGLPALLTRLLSADGQMVIEVVSHLDAQTVRGVALTSTPGLARGTPIINTGQPVLVPVGQRVLGRVFDINGRSMDGGEPLEGGQWHPIHQPPVLLAHRATTVETFFTGISSSTSCR